MNRIDLIITHARQARNKATKLHYELDELIDKNIQNNEDLNSTLKNYSQRMINCSDDLYRFIHDLKKLIR